MFSIRKSVAFALTSVIAVSSLLSASGQSTTKNLSSNFTLVNLVNGENNGQISYYRSQADGGGQWRTPQGFTLENLGEQLIKRQYDEDSGLSAGSGSVVVSTDGPVGAVVQIQARPPAEVPSFGAYVGVSQGAEEAFLPLVMRRLTTASGLGNSQVIIQNASNSTINVEVEFVNGATGASQLTHPINNLGANEAVELDLDNDVPTLPENWFGSATIRAVGGGEVAVVSNLFSGGDGMQTFNAFTETKTEWGVPLFAVRLGNSLSSPIAVQNVSGAQIPAGGITLSCTKDPASPGQNFSGSNTAAVNNNAAYYFNPVVPATLPAEAIDGWFGACTVDSGDAQTAVFVQLRTVNGNRAGAHEGLPLDSTETDLVFPLYAKRLANGFASAFTIQNLGNATANVTLTYAGGEGLPAGCSASFPKTIPAGGSLIQNHRLGTVNDPSVDNPNSVPQLDANCFGTLTVSSDQPIHGFAQLDLLDDLLDPDAGGDPFQAHNAFTVSN